MEDVILPLLQDNLVILLAALFLVPAFSLAGFPPLSGFWAKFVLVRAALEWRRLTG